MTLQAYKHVDDQHAMATVFAWSAGLILFAMVFDMFDGFTARLLHASSLHGIQMDSLADMTTFGVAPATLVAVMAHNMRHIERAGEFVPICVLCGIYLGCAALRLATYNVHAMYEKKSSDIFTGLPSPEPPPRSVPSSSSPPRKKAATPCANTSAIFRSTPRSSDS